MSVTTIHQIMAASTEAIKNHWDSWADLAKAHPNLFKESKGYVQSDEFMTSTAASRVRRRALTPPWAVSLPAQVVAIKALEDPAYYTSRYQETHRLRQELAKALQAVSPMEIIPSVANFLLCHLPPDGPNAATVVERCRATGLFLRDAASMGSQLGHYALRVAVKDAETNHRMVEILSAALAGRADDQRKKYILSKDSFVTS